MALRLTNLPASWGSRGQVERLAPDAAASLSRVVARAVADSGTNFQLNDAYRSKAEQIALFKANYSNTGRTYKRNPGDRWYGGTVWARRNNSVAVASPDLFGSGTSANHTRGVAVDIAPAGIQNYLKREGLASGWSWDEGERNNENWHFVYEPSRDQYRSEGTLDHAAVQKVVGAEVDGKIGTGTVKLIKAWQKAHGLTVDGKVGANTKAAMGLGKDSAPVASKPAGKSKPKPVEAATDYKVERHQTKNLRVNRVDEKRGLAGSLKAITIHHWGSDGQKFANVVSWLVADGNGNNQSSAHEVIEDGRVAILADAKDGTWNSGNSQGNLDNYALECRPEATAGDIATVAARVAAIRAEHGDLPIDVHADYVATACPGRYKDLIAEIDALARGGTVNLGGPIVTPTKAKGVTVDGRFGHDTVRALQRYLNKYHGAALTVDGKAGHSTWKALQRAVNAPYVDGEISDQSYRASELGNGITQGWEYTGRNSKGSETISLVQHWCGADRDGVLYEGTTEKLQRKLNTYDLG